MELGCVHLYGCVLLSRARRYRINVSVYDGLGEGMFGDGMGALCLVFCLGRGGVIVGGCDVRCRGALGVGIEVTSD